MILMAPEELTRNWSTIWRIFFLTIFTNVAVQGNTFTANTKIEQLLEKFNHGMLHYRHVGAELAWNMSIDMSQGILG